MFNSSIILFPAGIIELMIIKSIRISHNQQKKAEALLQ